MAEIIKLDLLKITVVTFKLQDELGILCHVKVRFSTTL